MEMDTEKRALQDSHPGSESDRNHQNPLEPITNNQLARDAGPPDGGVTAWLVVLGAWCCSFSSPGWINSTSPSPSYDNPSLYDSTNNPYRRGQFPTILRSGPPEGLLQQHDSLDPLAPTLLPLRLGPHCRHHLRQLWPSPTHNWRDYSPRLRPYDGVAVDYILPIPLVAGRVQCHWRCVLVLSWYVLLLLEFRYSRLTRNPRNSACMHLDVVCQEARSGHGYRGDRVLGRRSHLSYHDHTYDQE
jgi:hypothetical protein